MEKPPKYFKAHDSYTANTVLTTAAEQDLGTKLIPPKTIIQTSQLNETDRSVNPADTATADAATTTTAPIDTTNKAQRMQTNPLRTNLIRKILTTLVLKLLSTQTNSSKLLRLSKT
mgnify:CR=1 FL=1